MPHDSFTVGYADDIALVVVAKTPEQLKGRADRATEIICEWMGRKGLELAFQKSEAVILAGRRTLAEMTLRVEGVDVTTMEALRYLGIHLGRNNKMSAHIKQIIKRASKVTAALGRMMPNIGGPRAGKRRLICSVVYAIVLYGAPVWGDIIRFGKYRQMLESSVQRPLALRICSAYRTVSTEAAVALSGMIPIDLMVKERISLHARGPAEREEIRERLEEEYQTRWQEDGTRAAWTKRLIPDLIGFRKRRYGEMDYMLTQALTGHGAFGSYLKRFRLAEEDVCWFCDGHDSPEHTLFVCPRWVQPRIAAEVAIGTRLSVENMISLMLESELKWVSIKNFIVEVMRGKCKHELDQQRPQ